MKTLRALIYLIIFIIGVGLLIYFVSQFINGSLDQPDAAKAPASQEQSVTTTSVPAANSENSTTVPADQSANQATSQPVTDTESTAQPATSTEVTTAPVIPASVSTVGLVDQSAAYYNVTGTVKSKDAAILFPATNASIKKVNFEEGDYVKTGDIIVELTGTNLTEHPSETQLKIAANNLANAQNSLVNVQKSNAASMQTASLQLQSAISQANAVAYDLAVISQNQTGLQDGLNILQDTLFNTQQKNSRDALKSERDIDDLIFTLNSAQNDRARTQEQINDLKNQIANTPAPAAPSDPSMPAPTDPAVALQAKLDKLQAALDAQTKGIEDLYDGINKAKYGYSTSQNAAEMSANQILSQIQSSQNQAKVLDLNLQSTKTKLGYTGDSTDALQLAQQGYNSTKVQLDTALDNAQNQLKLAQLNYDLANNSAAALTVKAPFSGILSSLDLSVGEPVSPQTSIAEVINPQAYELEVNVDASIADRLNTSLPAQIQLAGRTMEVPVKSIAPKVDEKTHLVRVRLTLPPIAFLANQNLSARLPLNISGIQSDQQGGQTKTTFLPLDAVIIGTESQFVYINDNGKAKKVEVKLGQISGDQVEILNGLSAGDQVILQGAKDLSDGEAVEVK